MEHDTVGIERFDGLFELFERRGRELYLVGGCVRDILMGRAPKDYDFATDAPPREIKTILKDGRMRVLPIGELFGTIATIVDGAQYEITTYRVKESYTKGSRHPKVVFGRDLVADLGRRDLTINAMAMSRSGDVVDPFGGRDDIASAVLRVPEGGPEKTREIFADDPLRLLRVGRFAARYRFAPDLDTTEGARRAAPTILDVSRERWKSELDRTLTAEHADYGLGWLIDVGVLEFCLPELTSLRGPGPGWGHADIEVDGPLVEDALSRALRAAHRAPTAIASWAALLQSTGARSANAAGRSRGAARLGALRAEEVASRLKFSNDERAALVHLVENQSFWSAPELQGESARIGVRRQRLESGSFWDDLLAFVELRAELVDVGAADARTRLAAIRDLAAELGPDIAARLPTGLGNRLVKEASVPRDRRLGQVMDWLRDEIIEERLPNGASAERYVAAVRDHFGDDFSLV